MYFQYSIEKFLAVALLVSCEVSSSRILFLHPMASRSETIVFKTIAKELADKGHDITYVTPYPVDKPPRNFEVIVPLGAPNETEPFDAGSMISKKMEKKTGKIVELLTFDASFVFDNCHAVYKSDEFQKIYTKSYDLLLISASLNDCFYGLVHKFKAPFILVSTMPVSSFVVAATGFHMPPSFVPLPFLELSQNMDFWERLQNTFFIYFFSLMQTYFMKGNYTQLYRQYLGQDYPDLEEIEKNVSLVLSNSHYSMNFPKPSLPDVIEVGGLHCKEAKALPTELNKFLSDSKEGFIFFSLGSIVKGSSIPEKTRKIFINVFSKLKQRVLWKWETEHMDDLSSNVKLGKWLPQQDILGHPNIRLFITHGGLLSTQEAVYFGVPLLGLPIFFDQEANMKQSSTLGFGITLDIADLTEEMLESSINEIISNHTYTDQVKKVSKIFRDQPEPPLKRAIYWIEYVLRHKGAESLRSSARDLNFIQYHSYDVISFMLLCVGLSFSTVIVLCKFLTRKLTTKRNKPIENTLKKRN